MTQLGKSYSAEEEPIRQTIFESNLALVQQHNADPDKTWWASAHSPFADWTNEEFRKHRTAPSEFLPRFFEEWEKYEEHLDRQMPQSGSIGKPLGEAVRAMTDEQRAMLAKLAEETRRLS